MEDDKARATYALEQIALLYDVERQADEKGLSYEGRADLRSRQAYPVLVLLRNGFIGDMIKNTSQKQNR